MLLSGQLMYHRPLQHHFLAFAASASASCDDRSNMRSRAVMLCSISDTACMTEGETCE